MKRKKKSFQLLRLVLINNEKALEVKQEEKAVQHVMGNAGGWKVSLENEHLPTSTLKVFEIS